MYSVTLNPFLNKLGNYAAWAAKECGANKALSFERDTYLNGGW